MIRFKCNEIKTTQDAALFLKLNGGKMNYMKLMKLLYLTDREALVRWERPLTGDSYFSMKNGPILSSVLDWINSGERPDERLYWNLFISNPEKYDVSLKTDPGQDELSQREIQLIEEIFNEYKDYDHWQIVDICHRILPEWENPGNSSTPIRIEDILRVTCKTEREIALIEEEVANLGFCDYLLSQGD